jgi:transketolase N-terminal domain/subunit
MIDIISMIYCRWKFQLETECNNLFILQFGHVKYTAYKIMSNSGFKDEALMKLQKHWLDKIYISLLCKCY